MYKFLFGVACLSFLHTPLHAQSYELSNLPVTTFNSSIKNAFAGGMNRPQFLEMDLNKDDVLDLVVFDRTDASFTTYLNEGIEGTISYEYAPAYESIFDSCDCFGWAVLEDYTCDGQKDLFCGSRQSSVSAYRQIIDEANQPGFELTFAKVKSQYTSFIDLFVNKIDYPDFIDADEDGDLDVFTWNIVLNNVELHRNQAVERFGRCDTLVLERETECWGHFTESSVDNNVTLLDTADCPLEVSQRRVVSEARSGGLHTGSSTLILDLNDDGLLDALIGDISFKEIYALYNNGTLTDDIIDSVETFYPRAGPTLEVDIFPAIFHLDLNNDGKRDLVGAPNLSGGVIENTKSVVAYLNQGEDKFPDFKLQEQGFLQNTALEFGDDASPAFLDYNQDGLMDMVVGNAGYRVSTTDALIPAVALYQQVKEANGDISFQLISLDYLATQGKDEFALLKEIVPTAGDLDGDGDDDLLLGSILGDLYYFENEAISGPTADFAFKPESPFQGIKVNFFAAPELFDMDGDEDLDLLIGQRRGDFHFYENVGDKFNPQFSKVTETWGFTRVLDQFESEFGNSFPKPRIVDYDQDGEKELIVGTDQGTVRIYEGVANALTDTLQYAGLLFDYDFGTCASPAATKLGSEQVPSFIVGNERGGLKLFRSSHNVSVNSPINQELDFRIYPNPIQNQFTVETDIQGNYLFSLTDLMGRTVLQKPLSGKQHQLSIQNISPGIYLARIQGRNFRTVRKVWIR